MTKKKFVGAAAPTKIDIYTSARMPSCGKLCNPAACCIDANIPISRLETNLISTLSELLRR